ncbi:hypothetical protein [Legionella jamestowniensis]|uniref:Uncharacterized protein n=1 Tax=Legionella jamestowniensis TaxID=455 RepID=A0A0W0V014_9GAMM|nr:hypothetical protein [Legionella jamestowniensis]KTD13261.1 hypothetical protein Ljam_0051 [Legionella jamestowniensis]SFL77946.1 hypothetical protein SAMN02746073_1877 [Legionella jamestowniensis DSM 19215]
MPHGSKNQTVTGNQGSPGQQHDDEKKEVSSLPPEKTTNLSHVLTFVKFHGEAWDHSATIFGKPEEASSENYFSVYPLKEKTPPSLGDPDDGIANMRIILLNLKRMLYTGIHFESPEELQKFPHEKIEVPVTQDQFEAAYKAAKKEKKRAIKGEAKYSVIPTSITYSCAGHQQQIADIISTPNEKKLFWSTGKMWPSHTFENGKKVAENRKNGVIETPLSAPEIKPLEAQILPKLSMFSVKSLVKSFAEASIASQKEKLERIGFSTQKL